jgi:hypothetical protein
VQRVHLVDRKAIEEPVLDHRLRPGVALLARLEDQVRGAVEVARLGEIARGCEQHRRVAVVAAAVHAAVIGGAVRELVLLVHRQRIHVGAQADRLAAVVAASDHDRHDARAPDTRVVLDAERGKLLADDVGSAVLFEAELRMHVEIAAHRGVLGLPAFDVVDGVHGDLD